MSSALPVAPPTAPAPFAVTGEDAPAAVPASSAAQLSSGSAGLDITAAFPMDPADVFGGAEGAAAAGSAPADQELAGFGAVLNAGAGRSFAMKRASEPDIFSGDAELAMEIPADAFGAASGSATSGTTAQAQSGSFDDGDEAPEAPALQLVTPTLPPAEQAPAGGSITTGAGAASAHLPLPSSLMGGGTRTPYPQRAPAAGGWSDVRAAAQSEQPEGSAESLWHSPPGCSGHSGYGSLLQRPVPVEAGVVCCYMLVEKRQLFNRYTMFVEGQQTGAAAAWVAALRHECSQHEPHAAARRARATATLCSVSAVLRRLRGHLPGAEHRVAASARAWRRVLGFAGFAGVAPLPIVVQPVGQPLAAARRRQQQQQQQQQQQAVAAAAPTSPGSPPGRESTTMAAAAATNAELFGVGGSSPVRSHGQAEAERELMALHPPAGQPALLFHATDARKRVAVTGAGGAHVATLNYTSALGQAQLNITKSAMESQFAWIDGVTGATRGIVPEGGLDGGGDDAAAGGAGAPATGGRARSGSGARARASSAGKMLAGIVGKAASTASAAAAEAASAAKAVRRGGSGGSKQSKPKIGQRLAAAAAASKQRLKERASMARAELKGVGTSTMGDSGVGKAPLKKRLSAARRAFAGGSSEQQRRAREYGAACGASDDEDFYDDDEVDYNYSGGGGPNGGGDCGQGGGDGSGEVADEEAGYLDGAVARGKVVRKTGIKAILAPSAKVALEREQAKAKMRTLAKIAWRWSRLRESPNSGTTVIPVRDRLTGTLKPVLLLTREPIYSERLGAYTMAFRNNRVTEACEANFQMLVDSTSQGSLPLPAHSPGTAGAASSAAAPQEQRPWQEVQQLSSGRVVGQGDVWLEEAREKEGLQAVYVEVLQCGRVQRAVRGGQTAAQMARFNIDVRAPMSLAQAFAICLSNRGIADIMK